MIAVETPASLGKLVSQYERIDFQHGDAGVAAMAGKLAGVQSVSPRAGGWRIELSSADEANAVLLALVQAGVTSLQTSGPSLEEVYLHLIGDRGLKVDET